MWITNFFSQKISLFKKILDSKKILVKKIFGLRKISGKKILFTKHNWGKKKLGSKNMLGEKLGKNFFGSKYNIWIKKHVGSKQFFC